MSRAIAAWLWRFQWFRSWCVGVAARSGRGVTWVMRYTPLLEQLHALHLARGDLASAALCVHVLRRNGRLDGTSPES